jgi:hypothetical protein
MIAIAIAIAIAAIIGVIVYLIIKFVSGGLRVENIVRDVRRLKGQTDALTVENSKLPVLSNGQQYTYSMWVYLPTFTPTDAPALVLARGATLAAGAPAATFAAGAALPTPMVAMDGGANRLHVVVGTTARAGSADATLSQIVARTAGARAVVASIEYVPLQRWVHVAFTVNDALLTVYMDGDVYTVENVTDVAMPAGSAAGARAMFAPSVGDVVIPSARAGSGGASEGMPDAYLGRVQFFNYALTHRDVARISNSGPRGLGALGLDRYGLRSPIYRRTVDEGAAA